MAVFDDEADDLVGRTIGEYLECGWGRMLPQNALSLFEAVFSLEVEDQRGELADQTVGSRFGMRIADIGGLHGAVWEQQEQELATDPDDEEGRALLDDRKDLLARTSSAVGVAVRTNADLAELMRELGVFERVEDEGGVRWRLQHPLPLPGERLPLNDEERCREDTIRWHDLHYANARSVVEFFMDGDVDQIEDSLDGLGRRLNLPADSVREAILILLARGDFASVDVERIASDEQFKLRVDWEWFADACAKIALDEDAS